MQCSLCSSKTNFFSKERNRDYYHCPNCDGILMDPENYLSSLEEKACYEEHNNDVNDIRYQNFVSPIVNGVIKHYNKTHRGLDFGAGPGPVITKLLRDIGYNIYLYDPYFYNNQSLLKSKYDYIVCSEVAEHFYSPKEEFAFLRTLLKEKGSLFIMTSLYSNSINFNTWHYKNDPTHVFFYSKKTMEFIKGKYDFKNIKIKNNLIHLSI